MNDYTIAIQDAYSFRRPANIIGQALMQGMIAGGLTEREALCLFYSKAYRWALDFSMEEALREIGLREGERLAREYCGHEWTDYDLPQHELLGETTA